MSRRHLFLVLAWMAGSLASFSTTAISVRILARTLGVFEILTIRSVAGLALLLAAAVMRPALWSQLKLRRPGLHLLRNIPHTIGQATWSYCVTVLPLATVFALEFTSPIWVALLAVIALSERMTRARAAAVMLGLAGVLIVLRPGLGTLNPAALAMLVAAFFFATTAIVTKKLTATEGTFAILVWMNAIQLPLNFGFAANPGFLSNIEFDQWPGLVGVGVAGLTSHLCLTQACRYGDATVVVPLDFLRIPLIALVGWQFYGETLDPLVFLGATVIVAGITWNLMAESRRVPATVISSRRPGSAPAS